jgi:hypothetical protein
VLGSSEGDWRGGLRWLIDSSTTAQWRRMGGGGKRAVHGGGGAPLIAGGGDSGAVATVKPCAWQSSDGRGWNVVSAVWALTFG